MPSPDRMPYPDRTMDRNAWVVRAGLVSVAMASVFAGSGGAKAADLYVDASAEPGGDGSPLDPWDQIQDALDVAVAGDVVHVAPGSYAPIATVVDGTDAAPITVVGEPAGQAVVQGDGTALLARHPRHTFQGLVFDGAYGAGDAIDADGADFMELLDVEIRRAGGDCIDLHTTEGVLVANASIHHCVLDDGGVPGEAHGLVGDQMIDVELRDTQIFLVSGDAVQTSAPRLAWSDLRIRRCLIWAGALDEDAGTIPAGTMIGRSALSTRVGKLLDGAGAPPRVEVEDTIAWGYRGGGAEQAVFDLKEDVDASIDRVTVYDSGVAFDLQRPARVRIQTAVIYDVDAAVRYADGLASASILASTVGGDVAEAFVDGGGDPPVDLRVENLLVLGDALPDEATGGRANLAVDASVFVDAARHDYHLVAGSEPIDAGVEIDGVTLDRDGIFRPVGNALDVGAYEWDGDAPPPPPPDTDGDSSGGETSGGDSASIDDSGGDSTTGPSAPANPTTGLSMGGGRVTGCGCRGGGWPAPPGLVMLVFGIAWRPRRTVGRGRAN